MITHIPDAEKAHDEVARELVRKHLRHDVQVGHERALQDDRDVRRVKQLYWVRAVLPAIARRFDRQVHSETLK